MQPTLILAAAILLMAPCALSGQAPPELRLTRELRIDAGEHDLSPVGWLRVSANGTMVASQPQDGWLRFFDARGSSLGNFGRKGGGPGEFADLARNQSGWSGDTLWVSDFSSRRFTFIAPDRTLVRTVPFVQTVSLPSTTTEAPRITSVQARSLLAGGLQLVTANLADESLWPGGKHSAQPILRVDSTGVMQNVVVWHPGRASCMVTSARAGSTSYVVAVIPFCATPLEDFSPDGSRYAIAVVVGDGGSYRVSVIRPTGDTISTRVHPYTAVRITKAVADSVIERRIGRQTGPAADMWRSAKIPANYPPLVRVLLGRDDTIWLEKYAASGDREWIMLDGRGAVAGRVVAPRELLLEVVSKDRVWGIETDTDGLQHLVRYRVSR